MITGTLKSQVDSVWDAFWTGGLASLDCSSGWK
jgi:hypothetical protein